MENFGIDVTDAVIGLRSMPQKMKEKWSKRYHHCFSAEYTSTLTRKILVRADFFFQKYHSANSANPTYGATFSNLSGKIHARRGHENCCRFATLQGVHRRVRSRGKHFRIDPTAGVTVELKNAQQKKTEVKVIPAVDSSAESPFCFYFCGRCNTGVYHCSPTDC